MNIGMQPKNVGFLLENNGVDYYENRMKVQQRKQDSENFVTLSNDALSLMPLLDADVEMLRGKKISNKKALIPGEIYCLNRENVEGIEFDKIYFRLYKVVTQYEGVDINSLVLKEIVFGENGEIIENVNTTNRRKFSMPPSMCKMMGLPYSPGFELWPISSNLERVIKEAPKKEREINYGNMSTYPVSEIDGTIRTIILELHGFSPYNNSHIITPTGAMISTEKFVSSLTVLAKQHISTDNGCAGFVMGEKLPFKIVSRETDNKLISICDDKHNIYVEVNLTKQSHNVNTPDGLVGVSHTSLEGKDVDDVIEIKWDESNVEKHYEDKTDNIREYVDVEEIFKSLDKFFSRANSDMINSQEKIFSKMKNLYY